MTITEKVEFWFDQTAFDPTLFTLNDATKGELDSAYVLGSTADQATDVTDYVFGYTVQRGRSTELDTIPAGTATITLDNYDGRFIPDQFTDSAGPYGAGNITVGKRVTITSAGRTIFDGRIDRWTLGYEADQSVSVTVTALDNLASLGRRTLDAHTPTGAYAGARIEEILDRSEVGWGAARAIDTGVYTLSTTTAVEAGTNVVDYLRLVADTERGRIFAARDGVITFLDSTNLYGSLPVLTLDDTGAADQSVTFKRAAMGLSSDLLYTDVTVAHVMGSTVASYTNTAARAAYGIRRLDLTGLLLGPSEATANSQAQTIADMIGADYSELEARFESVEVFVSDATTGSLVNGLEIGDVVHVIWTPRAGDQIDKYYFVEGVTHTAAPSDHQVKLMLSPAPHPPFILDDDTWGILDTGVLAG